MLNNRQVTDIVNYIINNSNYLENDIILVIQQLENLSDNLFEEELQSYSNDICERTILPFEDVCNIIKLFSVGIYIYEYTDIYIIQNEDNEDNYVHDPAFYDN